MKIQRRRFLKAGTALGAASLYSLPFNLMQAQADTSRVLDTNLPVQTTWIANTFNGAPSSGPPWPMRGRWMQQAIAGLTVTAEGVVLTASPWDESGRCTGMYHQGKVNDTRIEATGSAARSAWAWGTASNGAIAVDGEYVYLVNLASLLLRFRWRLRPAIDLPISRWNPHYAWTHSPLDFDNQVSVRGPALTAAAQNGRLAFIYPDGYLELRHAATWKTVSWSIHIPGVTAVALASDGSLWIVQKGVIVQLGPDGHETGKTIVDAGNPSALAFSHARPHELIVCDDGPRQQVLFYDVGGPVRLLRRFGAEGGLRAGHAGEMTPDKLFALRGAGVDSEGKLYVGMSIGANINGTPRPLTGGNLNMPAVIRAFAPDGRLLWETEKYAWITTFAFDPASDGRRLYSSSTQIDLELDRPQGENWKARAILVDPLESDDPRYSWNGKATTAAELRWLEGRRLLYCMNMGGQGFYLFSFDESGASHFARYVGRIGMSRATANSSGWSVDAQGHIWSADQGGNQIHRYRFDGWHGEGKPRFAAPEIWSWPQEFTAVNRAYYDSTRDRLYLAGYTPDHPAPEGDASTIGTVVARYDNWLAKRPQLRWLSSMPISPWPGRPQRKRTPKSMTIAGDYLFVAPVFPIARQRGVIYVYSLDRGQAVGRLIPPYNYWVGWNDMVAGVHAMRRSDGRYLILLEDDYRSKNVLFVWEPPNMIKNHPYSHRSLSPS